MAKRKPFKRGSVGDARAELRAAQMRDGHKSTGKSRRELASAEKNLLNVIAVKKGRARPNT